MIAAAKMIFEAAGIGADGHAPAGPKPGEFAELYYADLLAARLPPLKIADSEWYAFSDGAWQKIRRASLRPAAQEILPADIRTARHEATLLDHLEGRCQAAPEDFRGFCRLGDNGEILINAANGIVRVAANQSPELLPHGAEHLFTQRTMAQFCPQAGADPQIETAAACDLGQKRSFLYSRRSTGLSKGPSERAGPIPRYWTLCD